MLMNASDNESVAQRGRRLQDPNRETMTMATKTTKTAASKASKSAATKKANGKGKATATGAAVKGGKADVRVIKAKTKGKAKVVPKVKHPAVYAAKEGRTEAGNPIVNGDARRLAPYSKSLNTGQVRVLLALRGAKTSKSKAIDMAELKDCVGIGRGNLYNAGWLNGIHQMRDAKPALLGQGISSDGKAVETKKKSYFYLTASGESYLARLVKLARADGEKFVGPVFKGL